MGIGDFVTDKFSSYTWEIVDIFEHLGKQRAKLRHKLHDYRVVKEYVSLGMMPGYKDMEYGCVKSSAFLEDLKLVS